PRKICFDPVPLLICKASSAHGCSPLTTLNQNFVQKGILECRQALGVWSHHMMVWFDDKGLRL
ncbi:hypothetical protein DBA26_11825, partial [Brucella canis]